MGTLILALFFIIIILFVLSVKVFNQLNQGHFDISAIYVSGTLSKGEEVKEFFDRSDYILGEKTIRGIIVLTNKRFIFLKKPQGENSHGADLVFTISWGDIMSVSASDNKVNVTAKNGDHLGTHLFKARNIETKTLIDKVIGIKGSFVEEAVIEAKTVIIEEGTKDKASEILQKRLARGEITLDEFHKKIQRT